MELQLNRVFSLLLAISAILAGCTKIEDFPAGESVDQRFVQSMDWNKSHPDREIVVQSDDYVILAGADSHVGGTENLESFLKIAKTTNVSAVVMAGDLTTGQKEDYNVFESYYLTLHDSLPFFLIAGNHDLWYNGWNEFLQRFGSSSYYFTVRTPSATDLFISLDTGGGTLGGKQLEWLTGILQTLRPDYRHCMVFTHNSLFRAKHEANTNLLVEEIVFLIDLFAIHRVEMVITAHDHVRDATIFGMTTYIQIGALNVGESNAEYFKIIVGNENIDYDFVNI